MPISAVPANIFTPYQRHVLLIVALVALSGLALYGLASYVSAFLGAGYLTKIKKPGGANQGGGFSQGRILRQFAPNWSIQPPGALLTAYPRCHGYHDHSVGNYHQAESRGVHRGF